MHPCVTFSVDREYPMHRICIAPKTSVEGVLTPKKNSMRYMSRPDEVQSCPFELQDSPHLMVESRNLGLPFSFEKRRLCLGQKRTIASRARPPVMRSCLVIPLRECCISDLSAAGQTRSGATLKICEFFLPQSCGIFFSPSVSSLLFSFSPLGVGAQSLRRVFPGTQQFPRRCPPFLQVFSEWTGWTPDDCSN